MRGRGEQTEFLRSFLDFCYIQNLDQLSRMEQAFIVEAAQPYSFVNRQRKDSLSFVGVAEPAAEYGQPTVEAQRRFMLKTLDWVFEQIRSGYNFQVIVPHFFLRVRNNFMFRTETLFGEGTIKVNVYRPETYSPEKPVESRELPLIFAIFFESLADFPVTSLSRCPQCNKIFFNPTRRTKRYCSLNCQNRAGVERYRMKQQMQDGDTEL